MATAQTSQLPHVAHVIAPASFGGLERVVAALASSHVRAGAPVTVIAVIEPGVAEPPFLASMREAGVEVVVLALGARAYREERARVVAVLRARAVDVVHTHGFRSDVIVGQAARRAGFPTLSTVHGFTRLGLRGRAYEWLQIRMLRRFDAVVAVSQVLADELIDRGLPSGRIVMIRNGIVSDDTTLLERDEARRRLGLPDGTPVVGWVGRLSAEKGPDLALRAFASLSRTDALLCVLGDGPMGADLRSLAERLGVAPRVRFAGAVAGAGDLVRAFDIVMLTSRTEGTPMSILEAGLAGVGVVATAVGGVPAVLGEGSPALVTPGDERAIADAVNRYLDDPVAAAALGAALRARVSGPSGTQWLREYQALYGRLAATAGARV